VQVFKSSQTDAVLTHAPVAASQESVVQALPSSQLIAALTQPVAELHESVVQALLSLQLIGV